MSPHLASHTLPVTFEFLEVAARFVQRLDRSLSIVGTSYSEYRLLEALALKASTGCARIDLAQAVGLTPSAVTRALKPLEKLGFVSSSRNARDARQSLAQITKAGLQLHQDARSVLEDQLRDLPLNALSEKQVAEFQARLAAFS